MSKKTVKDGKVTVEDSLRGTRTFEIDKDTNLPKVPANYFGRIRKARNYAPFLEIQLREQKMFFSYLMSREYISGVDVRQRGEIELIEAAGHVLIRVWHRIFEDPVKEIHGDYPPKGRLLVAKAGDK